MASNDIAHDTAERNSILIPEVGLTEIDGEPRARDVEIAERLGLERPRKLRELIERNRVEFESFGLLMQAEASTHNGTRPTAGRVFWLNEEQALLAASLSKAPNAPAVRAMLIRTFVAWRRGHLVSASAGLDLTAEVRKVIGGIVKNVVHAQLTEVMPALVTAYVADHSLSIAEGLTSGEVCDLSKVATKYPRGVSARVSKRLTQVCHARGARIPITRLGRVRAQVFPTHIVREWLDAEGRSLIRRWVDDRKGQGTLRLVPAPDASPR